MDRPLAAFDIETIPDPELGKNMMGLSGDDRAVMDGMLRLRLEATDGATDFLLPPYHKIVTISIAWFDPATEAFKLGTLGEDAMDEVQQLHAFWDTLTKPRTAPRLVTWNGNGFDVPVIRYRSMLHGIEAPFFYRADGEFKWNNYQNRYHDMHVDLMDQLASFGASNRMKLDELCQIMGLPGKTVTEGHRVYGHILDGEVELVREYCELDALNTLLLYLLWEVHRGRLARTNMRRIIDNMIEFLDQGTNRSAWQEYGRALTDWPKWS